MKFLSDVCVVWSGNCNKCVRFRRLYLCDALDGGGRREFSTWLDRRTALLNSSSSASSHSSSKDGSSARNARCGGHGRSPSRYVGDQTCWRDRATHWRHTSAALWQLICRRAGEQCHTGHVTGAIALFILFTNYDYKATFCELPTTCFHCQPFTDNTLRLRLLGSLKLRRTKYMYTNGDSCDGGIVS